MTRTTAEPLVFKPPRSQNPAPRGRAYVFAVVTLAAVLAGLLIFPVSARFYQGEVIVGHECVGPAESAERLRTDPTAEVLEQFRLLQPTANAASRVEVQVRSEQGMAQGSRHIVIRCRGEDSDKTRESLQHIADVYIQAHQRPADTSQLDARRAALTNNIQFWDAQLETTSRELQSFVKRELTRRRAEFDSASSPAMTGGADPSQEPPAVDSAIPSLPAVQTPNAKWKSLHEQIAEADVRLERLLLTHTEEHPVVIEARRIIEGLRAELAKTPQILAVVPESNPFVVARRPASSTPQGGSETATDAPAFDERLARQAILETSTAKSLQASLSETRGKRQALEQQLHEVPDAASLIHERAWLVQAPQITESGPTRVQAGSLLWMFLPAAVLGILFAALPNVVTKPDYLCSIEDVASSLQLSVRGGLETGDGPSFQRMPSDRIPSLVRRCVSASEIAVGLTIILVALCTLMMPDYGEHILRNPIDALGSTFQRLGIHR